MPKKKYRVQLSPTQREELKQLTRSGEDKARKLNRARILLLADENRPKAALTDAQIAEVLNISQPTVGRVRRRFTTSGVDAALAEEPRSGRPPKFSGKNRAEITAIACSDPPQGRSRWSMRLIADRLVELEMVETISHQSVFNVLKKTNSSPI